MEIKRRRISDLQLCLHSGISSRPLSVAMIAAAFQEDQRPQPIIFVRGAESEELVDLNEGHQNFGKVL